MTLGRLVVRNLIYHWRGNSAVFLGVVVGTAVLIGALLVGDSLRGSLRQLVAQQLGNVDQVLIANRLLRQEVVDEMMADKVARHISPALVVQGAITRDDDGGSDAKANPVKGRAGRVAILGVDQGFWQLWSGGSPPLGADFWKSGKREVVLNAALARELNAAAGDKVTLHLQKISALPRESILGRPEASEVVDAVPLLVRAVLADDIPGSRFSLNPSPATPRNAFVPLAALQQELTSSKPNQPQLHLRRPINALLVEGGRDLQGSLKRHLTLDDWGLVLRDPASRARAFFKNLGPNRRGVVPASKWPRLRDKAFAKQVTNNKGVLDEAALVAYYRKNHNYLSLESRQLFLEEQVARAVKTTTKEKGVGLTEAPTLVYLADKIAGDKSKAIHYAVVAALDPALSAPLGPFLPPGRKQLNEGEIVLVNWKGTPLPPESAVKAIKLTYYEVEQQEKPRTTKLRIRGWIPMQGAADDPDLTPEFPGITDKASLDAWDPPSSLHYQKENVTPADEDYWKNYRTTPKAYVNLATGQKLWGSRFGNLTSIRLALAEGMRPEDLEVEAEQFREKLLNNLNPAQGGLAFEPIRDRAEAASAGSNDFSMLFLGFSVFIIVAALLLVGLLFRLNLDRRASEIGLLAATGIPPATIRRLLLTEGSILAAGGALLGCLGAIGFAWLLLDYLRAWWPGGLEKSFLQVHGSAFSYQIGYGASFLVSLLSIAWAMRGLARMSPRALLAGETSTHDLAGRSGPARWRLWVGSACLAGALACVVGGNFVSDHEARAGTFFGSGLLLLVAGLIGVWAFFRRAETTPSRHIATLGLRNASRNPVRSLLTVGLLASAAFLIIAVEAFHKDPGADFYDRHGGSGGFPLLAESDVPLYQNLQSKDGKADLEYLMKLARVPSENQALLQGVSFYPFRLRTGDDASCLNLAQPLRPRLLGVSRAFIDKRGGFHFQNSLATNSADKANPWLLLEEKGPDNSIPVIGDATTVQWMLKSGLGQTLDYPTEKGERVRLRIVGLLEDSIFQSELLVSDKHFRRLFPHQGGYNFFLIDAPKARAATVKYVLETALAGHGFDVMPSYQRIETYLAVENTYLSTFQALGGLGLLLGALGLAVVLLRSVWERRAELALLRALGYRRSALAWLVLAENGFLLALGLALGAVTALVAVAPHVLGRGGDVPWLRLLGLLALVLVVGLAAGAAAVAATLRAPLVPALRRE